MKPHLLTISLAICFLFTGALGQTTRFGFPPATGPAAEFGTPGIDLQPFVMDHRGGAGALLDLSFLLDAPAGKGGFVRCEGDHLVRGDGKILRLWGFDLTEWSRGSVEIPSKADAPIYASALARFGVNFVRLHFLDLPAPRGMIDASQNDSQHFDAAQLDNEDFFISELLKRGIYIDMNLNVGRMFKTGDGDLPAGRMAKGSLLFDKRLIELEKDYAKQLLTHVNPYLGHAYVDEPGMAVVEIVNEDGIDIGWFGQFQPFNDELTDLYQAWLAKTKTPDQIARLRQLANVAADAPIPRLRGPAMRTAPRELYYTECDFFRDLEVGFFKDMQSYLKTLGVKCPMIGTSDHSHSGSGYDTVTAASQLDIVDGHDYWQHPSDRGFKNAPMVNEPLNSTIVDLSRTAVVGKPYSVSEMNHPFPNQFACEGIPILASYAGFQDWSAIVWYTFEMKRDANWKPYVGDPFDMSLDPMKMPQIAAGALMFERGDVQPAKETISRSYSRQEVLDSRFLPPTDRPYFTPGFPNALPLMHGSRIISLDGSPTSPITVDAGNPIRSDTGELSWFTQNGTNGLVTIDTPKTQGLVGFVKANGKRTSNLSADVKNNFCALLVNAIEDKPIAQANRLLLTAGVRVENTGMTWDAQRAHTRNGGGSPSLIEPVVGTITLKNLEAAKTVTATALDGSGHALGTPIAATQTPTGWQIPLGTPATTWFIVDVTR